MNLYVYYAPADAMAFDALRGMALVHQLGHVAFMDTPETCDKAFLLISAQSDMAQVAAVYAALTAKGKPCRVFLIHRNEVLADTRGLPIEAWSESVILEELGAARVA